MTTHTSYSYSNNKVFNDASAPVAVATSVHPLAAEAHPSSFVPSPTTTPRVDTPLSEQQLQRLQQQGFTHSLARSLDDIKKAFALRIWVVDNSGSMQAADGHRIVDDDMQSSSTKTVRMVKCTRWAEIRSCVEYHMRLSSLVQAPTRFRLLNTPRTPFAPAEYSIAENQNGSSETELENAIDLLRRVGPCGVTPLTRHIREIRKEVKEMTPALRRSGQRVAIIIATDGLPTDERGQGGDYQRRKFVEALRTMEGLPVWVVIRLCTDEEKVVDFYNDLDAILELSVDVLDDFTAEAQEIHEFNPWLNYALPLHRLREMGHHDRLFDLIDERPFTKSEIRDFCAMLFGEENFDGVPDPTLDWKAFLSHVARVTNNESDQWNPLRRKQKKWVSVKKLGRRNKLCG